MIDPAEKAQAGKGTRPRPADRRAIRRTGSAGWRTAISAIPTSRRSRRSQEILPRIPITAKLAGLALLFSIVFGVPLGVISAVRQNSALDYVLRVVSLSGLSMPAFWLGLLILMAFVQFFGTIPIYTDPPQGILERAVAVQHPGGGGRLPLLGAGHAADALVDAGGAAAGLHPHRARQGRLRAQRQLPPRPAQRDAAGGHRDRHRGRLPDGRADRDRNGVQHSGRRALPGRGDPLARLSDRAEPGDVHRRRRGVDQFPGRPALRGARSAHQICR